MTNALLEESTQQKAEDLPKMEWDEAEVARLLKLLPRDVAKWWDLVVHAIRSVIPNVEQDALNHLLQGTLSGFHTCWLLYDRDSIVGFVFTFKAVDPITFITSLTVYQIYTFKDASYGILRLIFEQLRKVAVVNECSYIHCQSNNAEVIKVFKDIGARVDTVLISLEV